MNIVNLTPHPVALLAGQWEDSPETILIDPDPRGPARATEELQWELPIEASPGLSVPCAKAVYGETESLPPAEPGTIYLVSLVTAMSTRGMGRTDVFYPGALIRDENGNITAAAALYHF
jgi:hypothetical protein